MDSRLVHQFKAGDRAVNRAFQERDVRNDDFEHWLRVVRLTLPSELLGVAVHVHMLEPNDNTPMAAQKGRPEVFSIRTASP